jgi:glucosyl-dolichyl phosphate glucuronosyltransferase
MSHIPMSCGSGPALHVTFQTFMLWVWLSSMDSARPWWNLTAAGADLAGALGGGGTAVCNPCYALTRLSVIRLDSNPRDLYEIILVARCPWIIPYRHDRVRRRPAGRLGDVRGWVTSMDGTRTEKRIDPGLKASVIVCAYTEKRWPQILMALDSITRQTVPAHQVIVVIDHNPALHERVEAEYPKFEVIPNEFERGLSGARNTGIQHSEGDIVVFLDDDARAEPRWLETMLDPYDDESVLGVGGLVLADWSSKAQPSWLPEEFLWVVGCSYQGLPEARAEVRNPVGANMSFRRSAFDRAGLFDSSVGRNILDSRPAGCEETEFSIRLLEMSPGARIIYEPGAVVHHHVEPSRGTWHYFFDRCHAEGRSKARVAQLSGASMALSSERTYVTRTIRQAINRELRGFLRLRRGNAPGRLAALVLGVSWTAAGYVQAAATIKFPFRGRRHR